MWQMGKFPREVSVERIALCYRFNGDFIRLGRNCAKIRRRERLRLGPSDEKEGSKGPYIKDVRTARGEGGGSPKAGCVDLEL